MYCCVYAVVVEYLETGTGKTEKLASLESSKVSQENIRTIFSGMNSILSTAFRQPSLKTEVSLSCDRGTWCPMVTVLGGVRILTP